MMLFTLHIAIFMQQHTSGNPCPLQQQPEKQAGKAGSRKSRQQKAVGFHGASQHASKLLLLQAAGHAYETNWSRVYV